VVAGRGSRSTLWLQIIADAFGMPVQPLTTADQSAVGAAMLAATGTGNLTIAEATTRWPAYGAMLEPNPPTHRRYAELLPIFRSAYLRHRDDFAALSKLSERP
ncbi:MAG TPA: FGGY-family carbohydrate kinase, partial [Thermomicrobiales bacterium]|nr:FGGY-family carbohydrate kinase [Thermomicrobiales bacterium]